MQQGRDAWTFVVLPTTSLGDQTGWQEKLPGINVLTTCFMDLSFVSLQDRWRKPRNSAAVSSDRGGGACNGWHPGETHCGELVWCVQGARLPADRLASSFVETKIFSHFSAPVLCCSWLPLLLLGAVASSSLSVFEVLCVP